MNRRGGHRRGSADHAPQRGGIRPDLRRQRRQHHVDRRYGGEKRGPGTLDEIPERLRVKPGGDHRRTARRKRRDDADHDPVDMEQRQHQQTAIGRGHLEPVDDHRGRRDEVGVVEHHALRPSGRPARVDHQRQLVGLGPRRRNVSRAVAPQQLVDTAHAGHAALDFRQRRIIRHHQSGARVADLVVRLGFGQGRVHRRQRSTEPPGSEHDRDQLDAVGKHYRHHITTPDVHLGQRGGYPAYLRGEGRVIELSAAVSETTPARIRDGPLVGQRSQMRHHSVLLLSETLRSILGVRLSTRVRREHRTPRALSDRSTDTARHAPAGSRACQAAPSRSQHLESRAILHPLWWHVADSGI
jgi:hypothetical protein